MDRKACRRSWAGPHRSASPAAPPATAGATGTRRRGGVQVTRVAAIDCGTNSIRLLIADVGQMQAAQQAATPRLTDVVREMRVVRLGQGVDATG